MAKYYIKITDEEPPENEKALWFVLNSDEENGTEFFALRRNEFDTYTNNLEQRFADVQESYQLAYSNFQDDIIDSYVEPAVTQYMSTLDNVENSTNANNLVDPSNSLNKYTYSSLKTNLTNIQNDYNTKLGYKLDKSKVDSELSLSSQNPVQNKKITEELNKKALASTVDELGSNMSLKSDVGHTHGGWKKYTFSTDALNKKAWLYYNEDIRMVSFRYYVKSYKFTSTESFSLHSGLIPQNLRPPSDVVLPFFHYHLIGCIADDTGDFIIKSDNKTSYAINTSVMWRY